MYEIESGVAVFSQISLHTIGENRFERITKVIRPILRIAIAYRLISYMCQIKFYIEKFSIRAQSIGKGLVSD